MLTSLAVIYVSPVNSDNQEILQCLSYFFPAYSYASATHQDRVRSVWNNLLRVFSHPFNKSLGFLASIGNRMPLAWGTRWWSAYDQPVPIRAFDGWLDESTESDEWVSICAFLILSLSANKPQFLAQNYRTLRVVRTGTWPLMCWLRCMIPSEVVSLLSELQSWLIPNRCRPDADTKVLCQLLNHLQLSPSLDPQSLLKLDILITNHEDVCNFFGHLKTLFELLLP